MVYQIQRSLDGSTYATVTESRCLKVGEGVLRRITTTATSSGTLVVHDNISNATVATGTLTSTGACTPASHGQNVLSSSGAMVAGTHPVSVFTVSGAIAEGETITIGTTVYTVKVVPLQAYDVAYGGSTAVFLDNLKLAVNGTGTPGVQYGFGTVAHTQVVATTNTDTAQTFRGRVPGTSLNSVATTTTFSNASWADTTLGGGTGDSDAGVTTANATITIGAITYTIVDELSENYGASAVAYQVKKGANEAKMLDNLKLAINGTGTAGTNYSTGTEAHQYFIATTNSDTQQTITARAVGGDDYTTALNALATTETCANTSWADSTFGGGTGSSNPAVTTSGATITIGDRTYTAVLELSETSGATAVADQVLWVTSEAVFLDNLKHAINGAGIVGTNYSTGTTMHTQVVATTNANDSQVIQSRYTGTAQNLIATTDTLANYAWGGAVLSGGTGPTGRIIMNTYTPSAGTNIDLGNIEFEYGLYVTVGGTSISSTFTFK